MGIETVKNFADYFKCGSIGAVEIINTVTARAVITVIKNRKP